jgi:hypothetical protein
LDHDHPEWDDENLYQETRRRICSDIQAITYLEWIPALLGKPLPPYAGYNPNADPSISNEFATAAFRFGHSMVNAEIGFLDDAGNVLAPPLALKDAFFNTQPIKDLGVDPILKYITSTLAEELDTRIVDGLRNFLFGPPGSGGLDLASLNIQRGRDHGLSDYNTVRAAYGLPKVTNFGQITSNPTLQSQLQSLYGSVDNIDLWVGGLSEDWEPGSSLGRTFGAILNKQFAMLRDGDSYWFERDFAGSPELDQLRGTRLSDVIRRNTVLTSVQGNVFKLPPTTFGRHGEASALAALPAKATSAKDEADERSGRQEVAGRREAEEGWSLPHPCVLAFGGGLLFALGAVVVAATVMISRRAQSRDVPAAVKSVPPTVLEVV